MMICVQEADFSILDEYNALNQNDSDGAIVTFVGKVRDMNLGENVTGLTLEHYPGMTEKALTAIVDEAYTRWPLTQVKVIHRIGRLSIGEQIVFVGVSSAHRDAAFQACEFVMDYLKNRAPFWKKEQLTDSARWIEARDSDAKAIERWK
jgi:molybdopterin synthase catalytic subunit